MGCCLQRKEPHLAGSNFRHKAWRLLRNEDGAELVEFALVSVIFFTLIFAIVEFALVLHAGNAVAMAAQQGARYAMVRGSDWTAVCSSPSSYGCQATAATVQSYVLAQPHGPINLQASNIEVTWLTTTAAGVSCTQYAQGCQVQVKVSYAFPLRLPLVSATIPLSSTVIETIQN